MNLTILGTSNIKVVDEYCRMHNKVLVGWGRVHNQAIVDDSDDYGVL